MTVEFGQFITHRQGVRLCNLELIQLRVEIVNLASVSLNSASLF